MKIKIFCPTWGMEDIPLEDTLRQIKAAGYDGVEIALQPKTDNLEKFLGLVNELELDFIPQLVFASGNTFKEYLEDYKYYAKTLASMKPMLINAHTGKDWFPFEQNKALIEAGLEVTEETGIIIAHETHRGRYSFSTVTTQRYFEEIPKMKITADFSHWCNVSESYLEDQPKIMQTAISKTEHIHARVGHPEGPQVTHPAAPECQEALHYHLNWWDAIVETHKQRGTKELSFTCEFGPSPYLPTLPFTNQPVASQWEINNFMKNLLRERYGEEKGN